MDLARPLLERALRDFEARGDEIGQGETLSWLAISGLFQRGDFERTSILLRRALAGQILPHSRVRLLMGRARVSLLRGDWTQAEEDLTAAASVVCDAGESESF